MIHHERSLVINAPQEAVWAVLGRYMHIDAFAPAVTRIDVLTAGEDGVGSKRRCHFDNGGAMVEEVVEWQPGRGYRIKGSELDPMPLTDLYADITLMPEGEDKTRVTWSMDYQVKYGPLGWILGQTLMKMMMGKVLDANLKGLSEKVG